MARELVRLIKFWNRDRRLLQAKALRDGEQIQEKAKRTELTAEAIGFTRNLEGQVQMKLLPFEVKRSTSKSLDDDQESQLLKNFKVGHDLATSDQIDDDLGKALKDELFVEQMLNRFLQNIETGDE